MIKFLYTNLLTFFYLYSAFNSLFMSFLSFLELFPACNCAKKVNNFANSFCEANTPLPFLGRSLSLFSNSLISRPI